MTVKAWLKGRPGDMAALACHFTEDPAVRRDQAEDYYLTSSRLDGLWSDLSALSTAAATTLTQLNGAARALNPECRPVQLDGRYSGPEGQGRAILLTAAMEASCSMSATISINGVPQEAPPSRGPAFVKLADQNPDVAEVFELMATAEPFDWDPLYKVYEIIRQNVGGPVPGTAKAALLRTGWANEYEIDTFEVSACDPNISGSAARHARHTPRSRPHGALTESEGRAFIAQLVQRWLDSL